jgi:adenylate cyclase
MMEERAKRKLTAILSADVKGYSRLMGDDEKATVETLKTYREVIGELIRQYRGRVVDSPGDNVLSEFASVVDAVECAVKIQEELKTRNEGLPENRKMEFRIGVHHGDVIEDEERIYGDGVNVAARIEGLAEGGGICISRTSFDSVKNKLNLGYEYLGDHTVKNIAEPVRVYKVLMEAEYAGKVIGEERLRRRQWRWAAIGGVAVLIIVIGALAIWNFYFRPAFEPASVERMAFPLPDKPSIAVLPFVNMSDDPKQEYFSDGITENIILGLSKVGDLFVIARNSSFTYKGKPVKVQQVSEDLGVRYLLEGSVMKSADRVRITAQLIDAVKGHHMWAERYDRNLRDIFAVQDEITMKILNALHVKLTKKHELIKHGTDDLDAYLKLLEGSAYLYRHTKEGNLKAKQLYEEAIALDPEFIWPKVTLGWAHFFDARFGWVDSRGDSIKKAFVLAKEALQRDSELALGHSLLGVLYMVIKDFDKAIEECERGVALNPNGSDIMMTLGAILSVSGRWEEGAKWLEKSIRHEPFPTMHYFYWLGRAYVMLGRYDEAVAQFDKAHQSSPESHLPLVGLAITYSLSGREEDAKKAAEEVIRINPQFSIAAYAKTLPYKRQSDKDTWLEGLRKAGLPETPPLPLPDKPSIAVLPFVNMSADPEQEYFSDGISEEIITSLSKIQKMFVIARTSSFRYKGKEVDVRTVGKELGVRYVLEGSVRKSEDQLRITAQLVDAKTGNHLWAESYDTDLKEIFALQDEITMKIISALQVELTEGEKGRLPRKPPKNLQAYRKYLQANGHFYTMTKEGNAKARRLLEEAIALDPEFPNPYLLLGNTHFMDLAYRSSKSPKKSIEQAYELISKAIALDDSFAGAHANLGWMYILKERNYDKAIAQCERAVDLSPNLDVATGWMGRVLMYVGRHEEAVQYLEQTIRLNPMPEPWAFRFLGQAYTWVGRYEEAIANHKKALQRAPNDILTHRSLIVTYSRAGRMEEARAEVQEVLRINRKYCVGRRPGLYKNPGDNEFINNALRKAGLPDCPPRRSSKKAGLK